MWVVVGVFLGLCGCVGLCVRLVGVVASSAVARSMGCSQRAVRVCRYQMVGCEWVIRSFALSTYPAGYGCVSYLFGTLSVSPFVMFSGQVALLIPLGLASVAA